MSHKKLIKQLHAAVTQDYTCSVDHSEITPLVFIRVDIDEDYIVMIVDDTSKSIDFEFHCAEFTALLESLDKKYYYDEEAVMTLDYSDMNTSDTVDEALHLLSATESKLRMFKEHVLTNHDAVLRDLLAA